MKKILISLSIGLLFVQLAFAASLPFSDLQDAENPNFGAIHFLQLRGVIDGYEDGMFHPEKPINRGEFTKILVGAIGVDPAASEYKSCFPDVTDQWFARYVCYAKGQGWIKGYDDGSFQPERKINKVESLKVLVHALEMNLSDMIDDLYFDDVTESDWFTPYVVAAYEKGLLEQTEGDYDVATDITRGEVSENIYRAMVVIEKDLESFSYYKPTGPYLVSKVVDGDTIDVEVDGVTERIRFIGMDTPETVHPNKPVQCFGKEASNKVKSDLLGSYVFLEADETQSERDSYGRLLRYVITLDGENYNKALIEQGYAFEYTYNNNPYLYHSEFNEAADDARDGSIGLWSEDACDGEYVEATDSNTQDNGLHKFYASSYARTKYYCDTDPTWNGISSSNLLEFDSEQEVLDWMENNGKNLSLNQSC